MESAHYIHNSSKHTCFFLFCSCRTSPISVLLRSRRVLAIIEKIFNNISFQTEYTIRINKPTPPRIIVPAPQVIQPRFLIEHIPAIPERLYLAQRFRQLTGTPQRRAPRIVAVADDGIAILIQNRNNIALQALDIRIGNSVVHHHRRAVLRIIEEVQFIRAGSHMHNILAVQATARCSRHAALS